MNNTILQARISEALDVWTDDLIDYYSHYGALFRVRRSPPATPEEMATMLIIMVKSANM